MELILIAAIATFFNFIVIYVKFQREQYLGGIIDLGMFVGVSILFIGTMQGMVIGMIASALMSIYLLFSPPKFKAFSLYP